MGQWILYFLFLSLPLVFCPFLFNSYELTKVVFFRLLTEILIGLCWLRIIAGFSGFVKDKKKNIISLAVILYLLWVFLTSLGGECWPRSLFGSYFRQQGIFTLFHFIFLFLLVALIESQLKEKFLALSISGGAILASFYAIFQTLPFLTAGNYFPEVAGTFGNPNFLGGYLAITLPFSFYLVQRSKVFFGLLPLQALAIVFSGSRIAIFLLLFSFCFYLFCLFKEKRLWLFMALFLILSSLLFTRQPSTVENRASIWRKGLLAAIKKPIFGWGLENFEFAFTSVLIPEKDIGLTDIRVDKAHNEFLEVLIASGLIGLGFYLLLIGSSLKSLLSKIKNSKNQDWWTAVFLSLAFFLVRSQVNPVSIPEQALFWLLIGLAASSRGPHAVVSKDCQVKDRKILSLVVYLCLLFMAVFNLRSFFADIIFKKGIVVEEVDREGVGFFFKKASRIFPWEEVYQLKARGL